MNFSWGIAVPPVFFDSRRLHEPRIFSSRQKKEFFNRIGRILANRELDLGPDARLKGCVA